MKPIIFCINPINAFLILDGQFLLIILFLLFQASQYGFLHLADFCTKERSRIPPFIIPNTLSTSPKFVDGISQTYLQQCDILNFGTPYSVTADGSCMFNSVSLSLCGSEDMATELRVRTCIEMVSRKEVYTSLPIAKNLIWVSPNYVSSTMDCAKKSGWSSIWTILALAQVIGIPIESVYLNQSTTY